MMEPRRAGQPALLVLLALAVLGCASVADGASATASTPSDSAAASDAAAAPDGGPPTGCMTLSDAECLRARELALTALDASHPAPIYVQVGPFGCAAGDRCPATLAARPEGDVVIESGGGGAITVHLVVAGDGSFQATRDVPTGIVVEPSSPPGLPAGPLEFSLGHCGIASGIDVGGSWWDAVGQIDIDSGDAINATSGVFTVLSEDTATFVAPSGFAVQLVRRDGPKFLPLCM